MDLNRRQLLTRAPIAIAGASLAIPSLKLGAQDAITPNATPPKPLPLPPSLIYDMRNILPILLRLVRTGKATRSQYLHLAALLDWFSRELTACHWNVPLTSLYAHTTLAHAKAGMPTYLERLYAEWHPFDPGLTMADMEYLGHSMMSTIVNGPVHNTPGEYLVSFEALRKAPADGTAFKGAKGLSYLAYHSPKVPGNSPIAEDTINPNYLYDACGELDFAGGFFGVMSVVSLTVPFMEPAIVPFGVAGAGMWLAWVVFCS
jgi:hypothetical protein